ncbi:MAG: hypothetical protein HYW63_02875 [Candidatus Levybacteria bacterium]|nr:hypothetical protein [Candidatus Levybacteria bacterium]
MSIDINLINKASEGLKENRLKKIRTISFSALFLVGFLSVVFFLIDYRFSANYAKKQQAEIISALSEYDETATKIFLLNQRLSDISQILSDRKKHHERAGKIIEKIPTSLAISEFQIDEAGISLEVSSSSLLDLNNFLNEILALSEAKVISNVVLDALSSSGSEFRMKIKAV